MDIAVEAPATYPEGQYAKLEMMGHRTLWGRISEVTLFGAAMLKIEPIVGGKIVGEVLTGAQSIYCLTKVSAVTAFGMAPSKPGYGNETLTLLAAPVETIAAERSRGVYTYADDDDEVNVEEIPEAPPPPPHDPADDLCDCQHARASHPEGGRCGVEGCPCIAFELELPF